MRKPATMQENHEFHGDAEMPGGWTPGWRYVLMFHGLAWLVYGAVYYADVRLTRPADYWQVVLVATVSGSSPLRAIDVDVLETSLSATCGQGGGRPCGVVGRGCTVDLGSPYIL
ncbi:MAG: hypothetical protein U5K38_05985 [Woeseiaceae bacterium]|nr:hypothetical protein [Woeseiaceae bacterium]